MQRDKMTLSLCTPRRVLVRATDSPDRPLGLQQPHLDDSAGVSLHFFHHTSPLREGIELWGFLSEGRDRTARWIDITAAWERERLRADLLQRPPARQRCTISEITPVPRSFASGLLAFASFRPPCPPNPAWRLQALTPVRSTLCLCPLAGLVGECGGVSVANAKSTRHSSAR